MTSAVIMTRRSALHQAFLGDASTPSLVRHAVAAWLEEREVPGEHRDDLVLAVNEAVTNVVDHAYGSATGYIEIDVELDVHPNGERWVTAVVTDYGMWRQVPAQNGYRGRGLQMISACTDWRTIEQRAVGTRVTMARRVH
jgi:anti-sigma regulatory factor (Ser/Thr protein kinase)